MMGWTGGGLGKGGQGISEPIRAADFNNRQGIYAFSLACSRFSILNNDWFYTQRNIDKRC